MTHLELDTDKEGKLYPEASDKSAHDFLCIPYNQILITSSCLNKFKSSVFVI